jgi:hypothetical protein
VNDPADVVDWNVVSVAGAGVRFRGTRMEAQEHLNLLAGAIETAFKELGITYIRREQGVFHVKDGETIGESMDNSMGNGSVGA